MTSAHFKSSSSYENFPFRTISFDTFPPFLNSENTFKVSRWIVWVCSSFGPATNQNTFNWKTRQICLESSLANSHERFLTEKVQKLEIKTQLSQSNFAPSTTSDNNLTFSQRQELIFHDDARWFSLAVNRGAEKIRCHAAVAVAKRAWIKNIQVVTFSYLRDQNAVFIWCTDVIPEQSDH